MKRWLPLLLAALALGAAAEPPRIGRLFMTPSERAGLDRLRDSGGRIEPPPAAPQAPVAGTEPLPPPPPPPPMVVTGIVQRSDGKSTVWINNTPQEDQQVGATNGAPAVTVLLPSGQRATLKAGQAVDVATGVVGDVRAQ